MKLKKITETKMQIETIGNELCGMHINDLLTASDGTVTLVVSVSSITNNDPDEDIGEDDYIMDDVKERMVECDIIGSIADDGLFCKSKDADIDVDDAVIRLVSPAKFDGMLARDDSCFRIGNYVRYGNPAFINGNKFFQRHSCIVGNTGSGKSETVAKILESVSKLHGANVIVFDIHGEYGNLSYSDNIRIGEEFPFPIWMFGFGDMVSNLLKIKEESATVVMSALRKCYRSHCPYGDENKAVRFSFDDICERMKILENEMVVDGFFQNGKPKEKKGEYNGKLSAVINSMESFRSDKRYSFLFDDARQDYLLYAASRIMCTKTPIKNIDLSGIPHNVAIPVIGAISKLVWDIQRADKTQRAPTVLVCDEAHVYIPNNFQLSASERRMVETFEDIAKEGRKFGLTMFIASQRPSELNKTIMAQCANFIVGKLNNENDKVMIKGMLPDGSESAIDGTTMFSPGDVLVVGDASPIQMKIHVELAKERPQSRTIDFWDEWKKPHEFDVKKAVAAYME